MPFTKQRYHVIVVGGGVMGCATLHYLAERGVTDTLLIERDTLGSGSTGRSMTILRTHYSQAITTQMALWSLNVLADFAAHTGGDSGFVNNGWMMLPERGLGYGAGINHELALSCGVNSVMLSRHEAVERWPAMRFDAFDGACWEPDSGYADAHLVTTSFAQSATARGAEIATGCEVLSIHTPAIAASSDTTVQLQTTAGAVHCDKVVVVTGPWAPDLLAPLGFDVPLTYARHQVTRLAQPPALADNDAGMHPTIASVPSGLALRPDTPGHSLVGYREDIVPRDGYDQGIDPAVTAEALQIASGVIPEYEDAGVIDGWSGIFTVTPDWNPILDRLPAHPAVIVGAGFSGHGFKMSPAIGATLAELAIDADTTFDVSPLRYSRFATGDLLKSSYGDTVFA